MYIIKTIYTLFLLIITIGSFSQKVKAIKQKPAVDNRSSVQKLASFFYNLNYLCSRYEDNNLKQLLADNLKTNKAFLKEWEIGLNNPQAQIWQAVCPLAKSPYVIDSSNKAKLICTIPLIKDNKKVPGSLGILQILPKENLDIEHEHDVIHTEPDAQSKAIGKVQPGEQYRYYPGTTGYSASAKQFVANIYKHDSEGDIGFYAIELDNITHKLGYISTNATYLSFPIMQLQYIAGQWKITKLAYQ